jgi:hypothetical protein
MHKLIGGFVVAAVLLSTSTSALAWANHEYPVDRLTYSNLRSMGQANADNYCRLAVAEHRRKYNGGMYLRDACYNYVRSYGHVWAHIAKNKCVVNNPVFG